VENRSKKTLKDGENELLVVFRSPIAEGIKKYDAQGYVIPVSDNDLAEPGQVEDGKKVSIYTRKAGYHFGWDWGPRLVTSGIWRPVFLNAWDEASIENLQIIQHEVSEEKATFTAVFEIDAEDDGRSKPVCIKRWNGSGYFSSRIKKGVAKYNVDFEIASPKLWWTNGLVA
jgi:beta-mannosidase